MAEPDCSAGKATDLADAVDRLPWFCPGVAALTALGKSPAQDTWFAVRQDPAAVLLLLQQAGSVLADQLACSSLLEDCLHHLDSPSMTILDWDTPSVRKIRQSGLVAAVFAEAIARKLGRIDPDAAWIAGLLAPLGWYAVCALNVDAAAACLADPELECSPAATQRRHWGLDADALARRAVRRWNLPEWLTKVVGHFALDPEVLSLTGTDAELFRVTRLAVGLAQERGFGLGKPVADLESDAEALGLPLSDVQRLEVPTMQPGSSWQDPRSVPLLRDLLIVAADNRRLRECRLLCKAEAEADRLHAALQQRTGGETERLRAAKLTALAEFAAGAGHEINNPLAVISGQAQYVLGHAANWFTAEAGDGPRRPLQTIITQTMRIHGLLRDLMQFARPTAPRASWFDLGELMTAAASSVSDLAEQRHVRLEVHTAQTKVRVFADRDQVRTALTHLIRNGVEAAPAEGWTRVILGIPAEGRVSVAIEDSGPGTDPTRREHLFDPFYSGRSAGRGRGLGLPTAWRLARLQGGNVRLEATLPGTPTRFVLDLPWTAAPETEPASDIQAAVFTETVSLNGRSMNVCHPH